MEGAGPMEAKGVRMHSVEILSVLVSFLHRAVIITFGKIDWEKIMWGLDREFQL